MSDQSMSLSDHALWSYFLSLDDMLRKTKQFCAFSRKNFATFSDEYLKIIVLSSIHFENCAKLYVSRNVCDLPAQPNMGFLREKMMVHRPGIARIQLDVSRSDFAVSPFTDWENGTATQWWSDYTELKHSYGENILKATQKNAIVSCGSVFIILLYLFEEVKLQLWPLPSIYYWDRPQYVNRGGNRPLP